MKEKTHLFFSQQNHTIRTLIKMFLYFYESKMIARVRSDISYSYFRTVELKKCDKFDMNGEMEDHHLYDGWEKEENEDGTFYLVFTHLHL